MLMSTPEPPLPDITNWLASIKQRPADGAWDSELDTVDCLSADLLPVSSSAYDATVSKESMSPQFTSSNGQVVNHHNNNIISSTGVLGSSEWVQQMNMMALNTIPVSRFQHVLLAGTSPGTRFTEETVTYLNQGQPYEIKLKKLGCTENEIYKSIIRVVFHERRLQYVEREQLDLWRQTRPGERIVDIDIPLSYGLVDVKIDARYLNCIEVKWNACKDTAIFVKVHCISTEFTRRKHGGEKGVPFRIQVETYEDDGQSIQLDDYKLVHCASCQVKVFKPKGADRKHKRDVDRIGKCTETERAKYHPACPYTLLTEIPLESVLGYLVQLHKHHEELERQNNEMTLQSTAANLRTHDAMLTPYPTVQSDTRHLSSNSTSSIPVADSICASPFYSEHEDPLAHLSTPVARCPMLNPSLTSSVTLPEGDDVLLPTFSAEQVVSWLHRRRFSNYVTHFQNYSGSDLLCLCRDDLIQLCGLADGIRLNNALQAKLMRPKLTIYVTDEPIPTKACNLKKAQSWNLDRVAAGKSIGNLSVDRESTGSPSTDSRRFDVACSSSLQRAMSVGSVIRPLAPSVGLDRVRECPSDGSAHGKRQIEEEDEEEDEFSLKKRCTWEQEVPTREVVFYALYLEFLTSRHFRDKMASLFGVSAKQVFQISIRGPSGIHVLLTDAVVQNLINDSRYTVQIIPDANMSGQYHFVMQLVN